MSRFLALHRSLWAVAIGAAASFAVSAHAQPPVPGQVPGPDQAVENQNQQEGVEQLTRGPVHEAYAAPVVFNPTAGVVAPKSPPAAIEELPPDQKPEGDVVWVPGYWSWDDERQDFIWISGIWRDPPPGMTWVAGYWSEAQGGFQWTSGFWQQVETQEVQYLPEPPQSLENGPNIPQPGDNYFWIPGNYRWDVQRVHYVWQPGYWSGFHQGWVWVPARYHWTPTGYIYTAGYWDTPLETRGVMFAPVYFAGPRRVGYYYTPSLVLNIGAITTHLFCRPHQHMYVFGDYYEDRYVRAGYTPWFEFGRTRYGCDPNFTYYNCAYHRSNPRWAVTLRTNYDFIRRDPSYRPPRTFVQQTNIVNNITNINTTVTNTMVNNVTVNNISNNTVGRIGSVNMATPLNKAVQQHAFTNLKMAKIDDNNRRQIQTVALKTREVAQERRTLEHAQLQRLQDSGGAVRNAQGAVQIKQPITVKLDPKTVTNLNAGASKVRVDTTTRAANTGVNTGTQGNVGAANLGKGVNRGVTGNVDPNAAGNAKRPMDRGNVGAGVGTNTGTNIPPNTKGANITGNNQPGGVTGAPGKGVNMGINPNAGVPGNVGNRIDTGNTGTTKGPPTGGASGPGGRSNFIPGSGTGGGGVPQQPIRRPPPQPDKEKDKDKQKGKTTDATNLNDDAKRAAMRGSVTPQGGDNGRRGYPASNQGDDAAKQAQMAAQQQAAQQAAQQKAAQQAAQQHAAQQAAQQQAAQQKSAQMKAAQDAQAKAKAAQEQQAAEARAKAARDAQQQQQMKQAQKQQGQQGGNQGGQGNRPNRDREKDKEKDKGGNGR